MEEIEKLLEQWETEKGSFIPNVPIYQYFIKELKEAIAKQRSKNMKGHFVIIDLRNMDFMKNKEGKINYYNNIGEACDTCGIYEFENAWVMKLMYNHIEK